MSVIDELYPDGYPGPFEAPVVGSWEAIPDSTEISEYDREVINRLMIEPSEWPGLSFYNKMFHRRKLEEAIIESCRRIDGSIGDLPPRPVIDHGPKQRAYDREMVNDPEFRRRNPKIATWASMDERQRTWQRLKYHALKNDPETYRDMATTDAAMTGCWYILIVVWVVGCFIVFDFLFKVF
jgi:hypothetical protein